MLIGIYSIYDEVAKLYAQPFFFQNDNLAIRAFKNECERPESNLKANPSDYKLYKIGEYDDETGGIIKSETPVLMRLGAPLDISLRGPENSDQ